MSDVAGPKGMSGGGAPSAPGAQVAQNGNGPRRTRAAAGQGGFSGPILC